MSIKISEKDMPGLFQSADSTSIKEQNRHLMAIKCYLLLLLGAAFFAFLGNGLTEKISFSLTLIFLLATLSILIWQKLAKPDDVWYNSRALAESIKTRAWRWMMRAEPYQGNITEKMHEEFVIDLREMLAENKALIGKFSSESAEMMAISPRMTEVRELSIKERLEIYKHERIEDQKKWYSIKSKFNKKRANLWFWLTVAFHGIAILLLILTIADIVTNPPVEIIIVAASGAITWLQAKKHSELAASYLLTASEISLIKEEKQNITTESELSDYVLNCENAFSREHTQWIARRNV